MNKIYKVIWSKAKHTYVVASEIAKGHTKGETTGKGLKKLAAAMLVAAALLSPSFAWAADKATVNDASGNSQTVYTETGADKQFASKTDFQITTNQVNTNSNNINTLTTQVAALETADKNLVTEVTGSDAKLTIKKGDGSTSEVTIDNVNHAASADSATKATQDGDGNVISTTYAKLDENGKVAKAVAADSATTADSATKATQDGDGNVISTTYAKLDENGKVAKAVAADSATTAESATKATQDGDGNVISTTYATKTELSTEVTNLQAADSALSSRTSALEAKTGSLNRVAVANSTSINESMTLKGKQYSATLQVNGSGAQIGVVNNSDAGLANDGGTAYTEYRARTGAILSKATNDISSTSSNGQVVDTAGDTTGEYSQVATAKSIGTTFTYSNDGGKTSTSTTIKGDSVSTGTVSATAGIIDGTTTNGTSVKASQTVGQNLNALDTGLKAEVTARNEADTKLQSAIDDEARKRKYSVTNLENADKQLQTNIDNEAADRKAEDTRLNSEIVKTNTSLNEAASNLSKLNTAVVEGFKTLNQADANEAKAREAADSVLDDKITAETAGRVAADTKLVKAMNSGLSLSEDNVLQKDTTTIDAHGNVTPSKTDANEMILNKGDNQITLNEKGIKVGTNSSVMDKNGVYTGGDTYSEASAALKSDGSIKGAGGKFTVDGATGDVATSGDMEVGGTLSVSNGNFKVDTNGAISAANGSFKVDSNGGINIGNGTAAIDNNGNISGKSLDVGSGDIKGGQITGTGLDVGTGTIKTTGAVETSTLKTTGNADIGGALSVAGDAEIKGDLTVDEDLKVNGTFDAKTLSSTVDANNYTTINGGKTQSVNLKVDTKTRETQESASTFDETGSNAWAKDDDSIGTSSMTADKISQSLSDTGDHPKNIASRELSQNTDNKYEIMDSVVDEDGNTNTSTQTASESSSVVSGKDGKNTYKSYITQNLKQILQKIEDGDGNPLTSVEQTEKDITNTAKNGTITNDADKVLNQGATSVTSQIGDGTAVKSELTADGITNTAVGGTITNSAKELVNTATGNMTNTVGGKLLNDVTGDMENKVGGNLTTTVTGDSSLTAGNINNEAKNKITNKALDVETDAKSSIVNKVSNEYGSNTSTQLSYETKEEMSQADGKTASYLRGAAEEKSQLTDGDKKTTIDTIAGQTNTNITEGTSTSNNLQKADQAASSVTDGTNTTVVNQDAKSLASSITDGAKVNNTNSTVDKSEQLIKKDDTHYYAETKTAGSAVEALKSDGNTIIIGKDAAAATVSSAVTDGATITGISQNAKDINLSAAGGTIANSAKNISNTATEKLSNSAAEIENKATTSINNSVGDNVSSSMTTNKITESVIDGTKSNTFTKTVDKDINIVTDGTNTSTESQLAGSVNTSLKVVDAEGKTSQSLSNVKTVSDDITKITDTTKNAFSSSSQKADSITTTVKDTKTGTISERSQTVSQVQDKVGTTTVTTTDGLTKLTNKAGTHNTQMDFAEVLKDLGVRGNTVVDGTSTLKGDVTMESNASVGKNLTVNGDTTMKGNASVGKNLTVKGDTTMEGSATVKKDLTVDGATNLKGNAIIGTDANNTLTVNSKSTFNNGVTVTGGTTTDTLHVTSTATFDDIVTMKKDLNVGGNVDAVSYTVKGKDIKIDENGINAGGTKVTGLAQADISHAGSTDAVTGGQLYETNTRVTGLETRVDKLDNKIDKVGANAAAMANLHPLEFDEDSKWNIAAAVGSSGSETASAVGVFYRPNENVMVNASAAMGTGENMFGGGVSLRLGHGGNKAKEAQMKAAAKENRELRAKVDDLTARMDALLSVLNPNMSKDFPDVPENHWAYEAVSRLAGNGIVEGYEDGKYHGERQMTRYEMAEIIYNALSKGAKAEKKLVEEFRPELQAMAAQKKA